MLTIFAVPKAFRGQFKVIQTNAIRSWTLLRPKPEIILIGDEEGIAEIAGELGICHILDIERNEYGTPLVNGLFQRAQDFSGNNLVCYVNSDIILRSDFMEAVKKTTNLIGEAPFLIIGRKSNVELNWLLDFNQSDWELKLKNIVREKGKYVTHDSDYFVFPKGLYKHIPPFAIGRCFWTQWFVYNAKKKGIAVIDATPLIMAVESKHDYSHAASTGGAKRLSGVEYEQNRRLFKGCKYLTTVDATHMLTFTGLEKTPFRNRLLSLWARFKYSVYFLAKGTLYPYSIPVIVFYRFAKAFSYKLCNIGKNVYKFLV
jgi:hypothetical protein